MVIIRLGDKNGKLLMTPNRLKQKLASRQAGLLNAWLVMGSPAIAEMVSRMPWDSITVDMQHGLSDYETTVSMLRALNGSEATPMVRVPWLEPGIIMKILDAGALGVICPMINTREQCEQFVACCRYAPIGARSFGPTRAPIAYGADYWKHANEQVLTFAMIETEQAVNNLEAILSVPGLDGAYIGPSDLALTLGLDPTADLEHPKLLETIERIRIAAVKAGKFSLMHCSPIDYALRMAEGGFSMRTVSNDSRLLGIAYADLFRQVKSNPSTTSKSAY
jgi:4-hydroxy-2-oxoheptanedioate aldolase